MDVTDKYFAIFLVICIDGFLRQQDNPKIAKYVQSLGVKKS
jgi:hypothetical protein